MFNGYLIVHLLIYICYVFLWGVVVLFILLNILFWDHKETIAKMDDLV